MVEEQLLYSNYNSRMNKEKDIPEVLPDETKELIDDIRRYLLSKHGVDTSLLTDIEMAARMGLLLQIADSRNMDSDQIPLLLDEFSNKFLDYNALVREFMMCEEGARH